MSTQEQTEAKVRELHLENEQAETKILYDDDKEVAVLWHPNLGVFGPQFESSVENDLDAYGVAGLFLDYVDEYLNPHPTLTISDLGNVALDRLFEEFDIEEALEDSDEA